LLSLLLGASLLVFGWLSPSGTLSEPLTYLTVPLLVWAVFRFGQRGAATTLLVLAAVAVWGTAHGRGPFVRETLNESLLLLQTFVGVLAVTALTMAAVLAERRQAEEELRGLEKEYEDLYDQAPDMYATVDVASTRILRCNQTLVKATGFTEEEIIGQTIFELSPPDGLEDVRRALEEFLATGQVRHAELQLRRKNGSRIDVSLKASAARDPWGHLLHSRFSWRDVTERKQAERRRNARLLISQILAQAASAAEAIPQVLQATCNSLGWDFGAFWTVDRDRGVLRCLGTWHPASAQVEDFAAGTREREYAPGVGLPGRVWSSGEPAWIPDISRDTNFPRAATALKEGLHGAFGCPVQIGGEVLGIMEFFSADIRQPDADLLEMMATIGCQIGLFMERRRWEEALRHDEARKTAILQSALDCIITIDHQGRIVEFNPAAEKTFGHAREEVLGEDLAQLIIPPASRERHTRGLAHYLASGEGPILNRRMEMMALRSDGTEFLVELAITPISVGGLPFFTAYLREITILKATEETSRPATLE
jgi:PAS domain S-box-containing protein